MPVWPSCGGGCGALCLEWGRPTGIFCVAEADLAQFQAKVRALQAFVAASEASPALRERLVACSDHHQVVSLARSLGFEIGRRWGDSEAPAGSSGPRSGGDRNLLGGPELAEGQETTQVLLAGVSWRLERIHSCRARSAEGFWYDQEAHEWVCLLQGNARLRFEDEQGPRLLCRGDALYIAPHRRHRVEESDGQAGTVWLALFWSEDQPCRELSS